MRSLDQLGPQDFEGQAGTAFHLADSEGQLELTLLAVDRFEPQPRSPRKEPFSLVFRGPPERSLLQGTQVLDHEVLGRLEIFLVPIGPGPDGRPQYEAVFN
jgi:hypothetical protein